MYGQHAAALHFDTPSGAVVYRVLLLAPTRQVDLAFAPASGFGARAATFRLLFGRAAAAAVRCTAPSPVALRWLYALHARACLRRGQGWRAEYMNA